MCLIAAGALAGTSAIHGQLASSRVEVRAGCVRAETRLLHETPSTGGLPGLAVRY
jgi:hypothetical protein